MARTSYHDFLDAAREAFDISYAEAVDLYRDTAEMLGRTAGPADLQEIYQVEPQEVYPDYGEREDQAYEVGWEYDTLDDFFDDVTDWDLEVDEGFEFEITATYEGD